MAGSLPIRRAGQCSSSTRGLVTARPHTPGSPSADIYRFKATVLSHRHQEGGPRIRPPSTAPAASPLERFLQLAGDFVGRGLHGAIHDFGGLGRRLVESPFDGWLANRGEPRLVSGELLSRLVELLAGQ